MEFPEEVSGGEGEGNLKSRASSPRRGGGWRFVGRERIWRLIDWRQEVFHRTPSSSKQTFDQSRPPCPLCQVIAGSSLLGSVNCQRHLRTGDAMQDWGASSKRVRREKTAKSWRIAADSQAGEDTKRIAPLCWVMVCCISCTDDVVGWAFVGA